MVRGQQAGCGWHQGAAMGAAVPCQKHGQGGQEQERSRSRVSLVQPLASCWREEGCSCRCRGAVRGQNTPPSSGRDCADALAKSRFNSPVPQFPQL